MEDGFIDIEQFEKKKKIGKGGYGKVYIVQKKSSKKIYAAKVSINEIDNTSPKEMLNISREVNIISKLEHPSILKFIGYSPIDFEKKSKPVIITEYSSNGSLENIFKLNSENKVPGYDSTKKNIIIYGIAHGMAYLHSHNIIHRDLKPDNIFLDDYLCPKIADFGLSKIVHDKSSSVQSMKSSTGVKGTPIYIAPEIWGNVEYSPACDVYSYSLIVYEILTGYLPFKEYNMYKILSKVIHDGQRPDFDKHIPESFQNLLTLCWSNDPKDRPPFSDIVKQLKNDPGFILKRTDKDDYLSYIKFLEKAEKAFHSKRRIIQLSDIVNTDSKTFQKVTIKKSISLKKIVEEEKITEQNKIEETETETEIEFKFMNHKLFNSLNNSCKQLVIDAEQNDDKEAIFDVACGLLRGRNDFPKNIEIGEKYLEYNASKGHVESMELYGSLLFSGKTLEKNEKKAVRVLKRAVKEFDSNKAKFKLAKIILSHESFDIDDDNDDVNFVLAKKYLKEAARSGLVDAMLPYSLIANYTKKNRFGEITNNPREALKYCKLSADNDDPEGMAEYGMYLETGYVGLKPNPKEALKYYKMSYEKGSVTGMALMGHVLLDGIGNVEKNEEEGRRLINLAFEKRNPYGTAVYVNIMKDTKKRKKYIKIATDLGNIVALRNAGIFYMNGDGVERDPELGIRYFKRAIEQGSCSAASSLGYYLKIGIPEIGFKPNMKRALKYMKWAADNGSIFNLHTYPYELSKLDNADDYRDEIRSYFKLGIEMGNTDCMLTYGTYLFFGKIFPKNIEEGKKLVKMAADSGNSAAMTVYSSFAKVGEVDSTEAFLYKKMADQHEDDVDISDDDDECLIQ